jgi:hypothetical protein
LSIVISTTVLAAAGRRRFGSCRHDDTTSGRRHERPGESRIGPRPEPPGAPRPNEAAEGAAAGGKRREPRAASDSFPFIGTAVFFGCRVNSGPSCCDPRTGAIGCCNSGPSASEGRGTRRTGNAELPLPSNGRGGHRHHYHHDHDDHVMIMTMRVVMMNRGRPSSWS